MLAAGFEDFYLGKVFRDAKVLAARIIQFYND